MAQYPNTLASSNDMYTSYSDAYAVVPNDSTDFTQGATRAIYAGGAGTISLIMTSGNAVTITVPANAIGFVINLRVKRILATGTTATLILGLY